MGRSAQQVKKQVYGVDLILQNPHDHAWMIHKTWSGDSSVRVLFFTRELGLIQALYKGGRLPKKQAMLQAFIPLWVDFAVKHEWYYVQSLEIAAASLPLTHHNLYAALYLNELLYLTLRPQDPEPGLYDIYVSTLQLLSHPLDRLQLESTLRRFEWQLLSCMGYDISLAYEADTNLPINPACYYQCRAGLGLVRATQGILGEHLLAMVMDDLDNPAVLKAAKHMMRALIDSLVGGKEIKTRRFFSSR